MVTKAACCHLAAVQGDIDAAAQPVGGNVEIDNLRARRADAAVADRGGLANRKKKKKKKKKEKGKKGEMKEEKKKKKRKKKRGRD